jgi:ABC-type dipeptide/oligopeptide/nickel transport system permease component
VLGMVILYSALLIAMGLLVDLLYAWLDPRVRFER